MLFSVETSNGTLAVSMNNRVIVADLLTGKIHSLKVSAPILSLLSTSGLKSTSTNSENINNDLVIATDDKELITLDITSDSNEIKISSRGKTGRRVHALAAIELRHEEFNINNPAISNSRKPELVIISGDKLGDAHAAPLADISSKQRHLLGHTTSILTSIAGLETIPTYDFGVCDAVPAYPSVGSKRPLSAIVTADKDEKIRVTAWPHTHQIHSFCLGHSRFISTLHPVKTALADLNGNQLYASQELLLSAGGDGTIRVWHTLSGTLLHTLYLEKDENADSTAHSVYGWREAEHVHDDADISESKDGAEDNQNEDEIEGNNENTESADSNEKEMSVIPDSAMGVRLQEVPPAVIPLVIVPLTAGTSSCIGKIFATFVEGESAIRLFDLYVAADPVRIPTANSYARAHILADTAAAADAEENARTKVPQVRLRQRAAVDLAALGLIPSEAVISWFSPVSGCSSSPNADVLAVSYLYGQEAGKLKYGFVLVELNYLSTVSEGDDLKVSATKVVKEGADALSVILGEASEEARKDLLALLDLDEKARAKNLQKFHEAVKKAEAKGTKPMKSPQNITSNVRAGCLYGLLADLPAKAKLSEYSYFVQEFDKGAMAVVK